jgi:hypothetical protein
MDDLDPALFQRMFHVDWLTFDDIIGKIAPFMRQRSVAKARN